MAHFFSVEFKSWSVDHCIVQLRSPPSLTGLEDVSKAGVSLTQRAGVGCWWEASVPPSLGPSTGCRVLSQCHLCLPSEQGAQERESQMKDNTAC